ncbi:hypothetical protein BC567DRAFT_37830 [Phyllosticta citribraziliensis]
MRTRLWRLWGLCCWSAFGLSSALFSLPCHKCFFSLVCFSGLDTLQSAASDLPLKFFDCFFFPKHCERSCVFSFPDSLAARLIFFLLLWLFTRRRNTAMTDTTATDVWAPTKERKDM